MQKSRFGADIRAIGVHEGVKWVHEGVKIALILITVPPKYKYKAWNPTKSLVMYKIYHIKFKDGKYSHPHMV